MGFWEAREAAIAKNKERERKASEAKAVNQTEGSGTSIRDIVKEEKEKKYGDITYKNDNGQVVDESESVVGELVGEVKQADYGDDIVISFSRWELMGFIVVLVVGVVLSALIVVAIKNNKRDHNRAIKNDIECDRTSETKKEDITNGDAEVGVESAAVVAAEVGAEVAAEINVAVDAEADTEGIEATVAEISAEESTEKSTEETKAADEKPDAMSEHSEKFSAIKDLMQSVAIRNVLGVVAGIAAFVVGLFAVGLVYELLFYIPSFARGLASYAGFSIFSNVIAPFAGCFAAKRVCERVSLYTASWNKPGCIVLRVLFFIFAGLSFVSFCVSTTHWSGANIFLLIQSVVFFGFGVAGDRE